LNWPVQKD